MRARGSFKQKFATAVMSCALAAMPGVGWGSTVSDRPLFVTGNIDHNLMFVVDDSGSMDWEILAPDQDITRGYLFHLKIGNSYTNSNYNGLPTATNSTYAYSPQYYYLRSSDYNLTYYDPTVTYSPWPYLNASNERSDFPAASPANAKLDPKLSPTVDLTVDNFPSSSGGSSYYPAVYYTKTTVGSVVRQYTSTREVCANPSFPYQEVRSGTDRCWNNARKTGGTSSRRDATTETYVSSETSYDCPATTAVYNHWRSNASSYRFTGDAEALGPDGECLNRVELRLSNADEVSELTGQDWETQLKNFANWFTYYRRRHQAIRGAIGDAVIDLKNLRLGMFWLNKRDTVTMRSANTELKTFLDAHYGRFNSTYHGSLLTPTRNALDHAGQQFKEIVKPPELACRKNFTLLFTDGHANQLTNGPSVGNTDRNAPAPFGVQGNNTENHSNTLGDIAYKYYQELGVTGGAVPVPQECGTGDEKPWMDCNSQHHMNTYTIGLGMKGEKFAGISHKNVMDAHTTPPNWNSITGMQNNQQLEFVPAQIDDLYHAAVNGKGEYYDAKSTQQLREALQAAVKNMTSELGSGSSVSFNSGSLVEGARVFSAEFWSGIWTGALKAFNLTENGTIGTMAWNAATKLDARNLATNPRTILTYNNVTDSVVSLDWTKLNDAAQQDAVWNSLSTAQQTDLKNGGSTADGIARLKFLVGDRTDEDTKFRKRNSVLGDIIHSSPVYVGKPAMRWLDEEHFGADGKRYSSFRTAKASRQGVVYVGANDGMLHGFNADTGEEVLGYIPSFVYSDAQTAGLHYLTSKSYDHLSYVDLPLAVSDVYIDDAWRTILIGGARAGAKGLFALDVTTPGNFTANPGGTVLWEFTAADAGDNLGHMIAAPTVTMLKWGDGDYRWSAVFSNGYNDSPSGKNGVFVLDIEGGASEGWTEGETFKFIELGTGTGLSPARLVDHLTKDSAVGSDGISDRLYAGDREGRLWAVDLTGGVSSWAKAHTNPLFTAKDPSGTVQPITAAPVVAYNKFYKGGAAPNLLVFFGTGTYLSATDINSTQVQTFYGVNDRGGAGGLVRSNLTSRKLIQEDKAIPGEGTHKVRRTEEDTPLVWNTSSGWFIDLNKESGERVSVGASVQGDYVVFSTLTPSAGDACGGGGSSWLMALAMDGLTSPNAILDVTKNGVLDANDAGLAGTQVTDGMIMGRGTIGDSLVASLSDGSKETFKTAFGGSGTSGRMSWREVYRD